MASEPQKTLIEPGEINVQMSAYVPKRWNDLRLKKGATWRGIIQRGIEELERAPPDHYGDIQEMKEKLGKQSNIIAAAYRRIQQLESKVDASTATNG